MTEQIEIRVMVSATAEDRPHRTIPLGTLSETVRIAIQNAVKLAEDDGFNHPLSEEVSIEVVDIEVIAR